MAFQRPCDERRIDQARILGNRYGHFQSLAHDPITSQNPGDTNGHLCADHLRKLTYRVGARISEHGRFVSWKQSD
jgi:hypothetical protein